MVVWYCKIGSKENLPLPDGADSPMRVAARNAFLQLTGQDDQFCFSGWGQQLTESELAVVENREPVRELVAQEVPEMLRAEIRALREENTQLRNFCEAAILKRAPEAGYWGRVAAKYLELYKKVEAERDVLEPDAKRWRYVREEMHWCEFFDDQIRWVLILKMPEPNIVDIRPPGSIQKDLDAGVDSAIARKDCEQRNLSGDPETTQKT